MNRFADTPQGTTGDVSPYLHLVRRFGAGEIDASRYQQDFAELWRRQRFFLPEGMYDVMQALFDANEDFVAQDELRDSGELDPEQLRARVVEIEPELVFRFDAARRREAGGG